MFNRGRSINREENNGDIKWLLIPLSVQNTVRENMENEKYKENNKTNIGTHGDDDDDDTTVPKLNAAAKN